MQPWTVCYRALLLGRLTDMHVLLHYRLAVTANKINSDFKTFRCSGSLVETRHGVNCNYRDKQALINSQHHQRVVVYTFTLFCLSAVTEKLTKRVHCHCLLCRAERGRKDHGEDGGRDRAGHRRGAGRGGAARVDPERPCDPM